jgi:hypothetical protein
LEAVIDQTVNRALDLFDIELDRDLFPRWTGPPERTGSRSLGGEGGTQGRLPPGD